MFVYNTGLPTKDETPTKSAIKAASNYSEMVNGPFKVNLNTLNILVLEVFKKLWNLSSVKYIYIYIYVYKGNIYYICIKDIYIYIYIYIYIKDI